MEFRAKNVQYISSRQNAGVLLAASLGERKYREKERKFRFDGIKLFREAVACGIEIFRVLVCENKADAFLPEIEALCPGIDVFVLSESAFSKISEEKSPEGIITVAKYIDKRHKIVKINNSDDNSGEISVLIPVTTGNGRVMALESLRDPGNVGTVIRTAAAFGVQTLILSSDCADIYNPRTVRAAMGALFSTQIVVCDDLPAALRFISAHGRRVLAAALSDDALTLGRISLCPTDVVVIGNEGHGLSAAAIDACDAKVILPMRRGPGIESLNAATAASVFMWELGRNEI